MIRLVILAVLVHLSASVISAGFEVRVDGETVHHELRCVEGDPDRPRPGDVVWLGGPWSVTDGDDVVMTLVDAGDLELRSGASVLLEGDRVVWARIAEDEGVVRNPLETLSAEEVRGVRGVFVGARGEAVSKSLERLDPALVTITVGKEGTTRPGDALPPLPAKLERLWIDPGVSPSFTGGIASVGRLERLQLLRLIDAPGLPNAVLGRLVRLRYLSAPTRPAADLGALARLTRLRELGLSWSGDVLDIGFVRALSELRRLGLGWTDVTSLAPLTDHPALREIRVSDPPVTELPGGSLPELRLLRSLGAPISAEREAAFRRLNPRCVLEIRRVDVLRAAVAGADRIRILAGDEDFCERVVKEIEGRDAIEEFLLALDVVEDECGGAEACARDPRVLFLRGEQVLECVGFRCSGCPVWRGADGDVTLTPASHRAIEAWFEKYVERTREAIRAESGSLEDLRRKGR